MAGGRHPADSGARVAPTQLVDAVGGWSSRPPCVSADSRAWLRRIRTSGVTAPRRELSPLLSPNMSEAEQSLMPGPQGRTPHFYDVDRGVKTESYITAVSRNPVPPIHSTQKPAASYSKVTFLNLRAPKRTSSVGLRISRAYACVRLFRAFVYQLLSQQLSRVIVWSDVMCGTHRII